MVQGRILETYKRLGGYRTFGNAIIPESDAGRGGKFQVFEQASSIYWHPNVSHGVARQVKGAIRDRWRDWGWENGPLRYPTTDELTTPDRVGRFNHFEDGSIYWTPGTGAQIVKGRVRDYWASRGWETGLHGYPVGEEYFVDGGINQDFQNLSIQWVEPISRRLPTGDHINWDGYQM